MQNKTNEEKTQAYTPFIYAGITALIAAIATDFAILCTSNTIPRPNIHSGEFTLMYAFVGLCTGLYMATLHKNTKAKAICLLSIIVGSVIPIMTMNYFNDLILGFFSSGLIGILLSLPMKKIRVTFILAFLSMGAPFIALAFTLSLSPIIVKVPGFSIFIIFNMIYSFFMSLCYYLIYKSEQQKHLSVKQKESPL